MASCELNLFCTHETEEKELCSGYLYKSPPENRIKSKKSWKRRFFVLKKSKTSCQLEYYKNEERRSPELLGVIDLSHWEVDKWFRSLFDALYDRPHKLLDPQDSGKIRDISAPPPSLNTNQGAGWTFDA
ncbi:hypothetical protein NFI96_016131 [Prochilodus magdalenae]|nr:hypothetical protein NFI96_016131 [Prochilodus magdalenae]